MLQSLEDGLSDRILSSIPDRLHKVIDRACLETPDRLAIADDLQSWTYQELHETVGCAATALRERGVRPGDRMMIVSENCVELAALIFAASSLDAWAIVVNPRLSGREIEQIREHSGARLMLFAVGASKEAAAHAASYDAHAERLGSLDRIALSPLNEDAQVEKVERSGAAQVAVLIYTSGTTGAPKGVMLTHQNLLFSAGVTGAIRRITAVDKLYGVLPISHIVGISLLVMTFLSGASIRLSAKFDPAALKRALLEDGITMLSGVPATYQRLLEHMTVAGIEKLDIGNLRFIGVSGAPLDIHLKRRVEAKLGLSLLNGFGITECSPGISGVRMSSPRDDQAVGFLLPGVEARIVDRAGTVVESTEVGELHVRGPNVMRGYYRSPELTAKAIDRDGWFNTGDLAQFVDGALFVVGRTKEMIIRSGFNVYPAEVEAVLSSHPAVVQCAVVGRPVEGNEEVVAFVQFLDGANVGVEDLARHIKPQLTAYKHPSEIIVMPALPATSTGKILKHKLAESLRI